MFPGGVAPHLFPPPLFFLAFLRPRKQDTRGSGVTRGAAQWQRRARSRTWERPWGRCDGLWEVWKSKQAGVAEARSLPEHHARPFSPLNDLTSALACGSQRCFPREVRGSPASVGIRSPEGLCPRFLACLCLVDKSLLKDSGHFMQGRWYGPSGSLHPSVRQL